MSLKQLSSNKHIAEQLSSLLSGKRLIHAFLFCGGSSESRDALGLAFAKALLCTESEDDSCDLCLSCRKFEQGDCEDLIIAEKPEDKASITVSVIEELQQKLRFKPYGSRHVVIVRDAHLMNMQAQNKFLKSLEEPASDTVMILLSESRDALLSTVLSRCSTYYLEEASALVSDIASAAADQMLELIAQGAAFYRKKQCLEPVLTAKDQQRELALSFLDICLERLSEAVSDAGHPLDKDIKKVFLNASKAVIEAQRQVRTQQNTSYSLKQMCLRI